MTGTFIEVSRDIAAPAQQVFAVLRDPARHPEFDGSGFMRDPVDPEPIGAVGDTFRMNMSGDHMGGDYQVDNHVTVFEPDEAVGWKTAPAGEEPPGWEWTYRLVPDGAGETRVTLTYDWSAVTDPEILDKIDFPLVGESELDESLDQLADAVGR